MIFARSLYGFIDFLLKFYFNVRMMINFLFEAVKNKSIYLPFNFSIAMTRAVFILTTITNYVYNAPK